MSVDLRSFKRTSLAKPTQTNKKPLFGMDALVSLATKDIKLFSKFGNKQKERFFSEIGMLLSAGVDLQTVLVLSSQASQEKNKLHVVYKRILDEIAMGNGLASAMEATGQFNNFDCYSVLIGENTGELAQVFNKLSTYYTKRIVQKRKINSSLSYPVIVLFTTMGAIYFMLNFVVPMFAETLTRFGGELPPLTKFIIDLSHHITSYFLITLSLVGILYFLYRKNREKEQLRHILSSLMLKIPYIGKVIYKTHLVQFTQAMDLLLNSHVNIVESIQLTIKMVRFYPLNKALANIKEDILKGEFFYKSMEKQSFFDHSMVTLIRIGEEVNQLDKIFVQLSKQYENELEYQSGILISILEPIMILILAMLVAVILVAMYLPMFKIGTVIH